MKILNSIPDFLQGYAYSTAIIFIISLGFTYLIGRMLNLAHGNTVKNVIATIFMTLSSIFSVLLVKYISLLIVWIDYGFHELFSRANILTTIFYFSDIILVFTTTVILYVLFAFKLYSRVDKLLDKKWPDEEIVVVEETPTKVKTATKRKRKK